jgi:hypothetical protein
MIRMTAWFETVHPLTYLFTAQSVMWAFMVILHAMIEQVNILRVGEMFWPEPLTYIWAVTLLVTGLILLFFYLRDFRERKRDRIWLTLRINLFLWAWALVFWIMVAGSQVLILISIVNIIGFSYIGLACKQNREYHRI